ENNFTADRSQAHLPWMNARLCFILKYILLRQTLYRGEHDVYSESLFSRITNCFYLIIIMLNVIRTVP
ncbi:MAG: hypothetical protein ACFNLR_08225, partial [Prevotella denticola]